LSKKYHIPTKTVSSRIKPIGKFMLIRDSECINCGLCLDICVFGVHERNKDDIRRMAEPLNHLCKDCFACVRNCPKNSLKLVINPDYKRLRNGYITPDSVLSLLAQAETGKIPVFGAGYKGVFADIGFDGIWTDMSEIVRPTRDGIHGREYISTNIDLGRKLPDLTNLDFYPDGRLKSNIPPTREVPIPILFSYTGKIQEKKKVITAISVASTLLGTYTKVDFDLFSEQLQPYINHLIFGYSKKLGKNEEMIRNSSIIEFDDLKNIFDTISVVKNINPHILTIIKIDSKKALNEPEILFDLVEKGAEIVHITGVNDTKRNIKEEEVDFIDAISGVHKSLVEKGIRDRITILASGPIILAEHVVKTIILGADGVFIDIPLFIALECLCCDECHADGKCPSDLDNINIRWGAQRVINLMASWHSQMLEVLGAMGMRDVRRLRGEVGRAMFFKDLEKEIFEPIFKRNKLKQKDIK
jgi:ferredoxin